MKKMLLLSITMILSVSLFGCNSNGVDSKMIIPNQLVLTQGDSISVNGESSRYSLHSLDFIDKNLGWVVRSDDNSNEHCSQILKTEDGGVSWKTLKLNNSNIQRLMFVNKTTGWAVGQADSKNTINEESSLIKILHTQDGGQEWDVQWEGKVNLSSGYHLWFQDTMNGYALISGTLLSTRDGGKQWSQVICGIKDFTPQHMSFVNVDTGWVVGKINWIDKNMPEYSRRYLIGPAKQFCAGPDSILVDDSNKNIEDFAEAGGNVILVPRPWNSNYRERHCAMAWVKWCLENLS